MEEKPAAPRVPTVVLLTTDAEELHEQIRHDRPAPAEPVVRRDRSGMGQARIVDRPRHQRQAGAGDQRQQSDARRLGDTPLRPLAQSIGETIE